MAAGVIAVAAPAAAGLAPGANPIPNADLEDGDAGPAQWQWGSARLANASLLPAQ